MELYNMNCPVCGTLNRRLDLEETSGWMECINCGQITVYLKTAHGPGSAVNDQDTDCKQGKHYFYSVRTAGQEVPRCDE